MCVLSELNVGDVNVYQSRKTSFTHGKEYQRISLKTTNKELSFNNIRSTCKLSKGDKVHITVFKIFGIYYLDKGRFYCD